MRRGWAFGLVVGALLAGCDLPVSGAVTTSPAALPRPELKTEAPEGASAELTAYYQRIEDSLRARGLLRTDRNPPDAPYYSRDLVRTFLKTAFYEEYSAAAGQLVSRENASRLHRFAAPVRLSVEFGPTVSASKRARDAATVSRLIQRLSRATGHPMTQVAPGSGNLRVFVVNEAERRALAKRLPSIMPGISRAAQNTVANLPATTYCIALASDPQGDGTYEQVVAIVRGEHPDLMRKSCLHEEIAQGLGLANDYALARPSIFNDDEEFSLLTLYDEHLLTILYDPRLSPGMRERQARPIVETIAGEILGEAL
ncbi:MAG: hypothetical protein CR993_08625 [Rhodobacterales bacterium]|nr:MAG: hypothetical protein CR993_08625 [Rhodobacterales bacterium]